MKAFYKNLLHVTLNTGLCLLFVFTAGAQSGKSSGGGSSGGKSSSGGGSAASSRPSGGNNAGMARPSGMQRPTGGGISPLNRQGVSSPARGNYGYARQGASVAGRGNFQGASTRGNYGFAPRVGATHGAVNGSAGYRTAPNIGYGRSFFGNHGYFYNNRGFYNSYYRPRLGFRIGVLPYGYYPFFYGDYQYFYCDGLFYQFDDSEYTVVEPPIGAQLTTLPDKAQSIVINGQQYYELDGVYYMPVTKDDGTIVYEVAGKDGQLNTTDVQDTPQGPRMGDVVLQLPADCRKINVNSQKLYVSPDGVYYQEQVDANNNKTYKVVGLPSDEAGQN